ncbi:hypothetical protein [Streptomyces sp. NBC_00878]|uniref:hypothetical protein n=1 Tax=Streptomyces sp. NBC_00878 TaxID=2975854 RepID=UPI002252DECA|nr:hypothetical protein [Streptomyces sp. NBC_00878]MCX4908588.1 hypothetical protein [Streptomyces sp. NBC_00878]
MPHRVIRSAVTVLLASAPLFAAVPAQAAAKQNFPCNVALVKVDNVVTSTVTLAVECDETQTLGVRISAGGTEIVNLQQTVEADVRQTLAVTVPRFLPVCATLEADGESTTICTP